MLIAGLWPRVAAAATMEFGRPTLERNHFRKLTKQSTHISVGIPGRSNTASRFFATADVCCRLVEFRGERQALDSLTGKGIDMSTPFETDTVDMAAPPIVGSDRSVSRSCVAVVDMAGLTDRGKRRTNNEHHFLISRFGRFLETLDTNLSPADTPFREEETGYGLLVADGMGGHAGGEVASKLAISTLINLTLEDGDILLLCTDGLTDMVGEDLIQATLDREEGSKTICRRLVEQALEAGGKDNVTVVLARALAPSKQTSGLLARFKGFLTGG